LLYMKRTSAAKVGRWEGMVLFLICFFGFFYFLVHKKEEKPRVQKVEEFTITCSSTNDRATSLSPLPRFHEHVQSTNSLLPHTRRKVHGAQLIDAARRSHRLTDRLDLRGNGSRRRSRHNRSAGSRRGGKEAWDVDVHGEGNRVAASMSWAP